jgi:hypothetical protein
MRSPPCRDAEVQPQAQLLRPARHDGRALTGDDFRLDPRFTQPLDTHAVA